MFVVVAAVVIIGVIWVTGLVQRTTKPESREKLLALRPILLEFAPNIRSFGRQVVVKFLREKQRAWSFFELHIPCEQNIAHTTGLLISIL